MPRAITLDREAMHLKESLMATVAIGIVDYAFPFYLSNISSIARFIESVTASA